MTDAKPGPVAVRVTRPYDTEEEFLASEVDTLGRAGIVLVGAPQRPTGVVLRFEVLLRTGQPLLRGEGRVLAYRDDAYDDSPGLALKFTKLDARSKALVDRAAALRGAQRGETEGAAEATPAPPSVAGSDSSPDPDEIDARPAAAAAEPGATWHGAETRAEALARLKARAAGLDDARRAAVVGGDVRRQP